MILQSCDGQILLSLPNLMESLGRSYDPPRKPDNWVSIEKVSKLCDAIAEFRLAVTKTARVPKMAQYRNAS